MTREDLDNFNKCMDLNQLKRIVCNASDVSFQCAK